jgi:protein gp37
MSDKTHIEWTDSTWNPLLGCDKCTAGCQFCYAIRTAWRLMHNPNQKVAAAYAGLVEQRPDGSLNWTGKINLIPDRLVQPIEWTKPRRIFVNSQSDLFHPDVPDSFIDQVFAVMAACPQHTFQVLTKRADRMAEYTAGAEGRIIRAGEALAVEHGWCHARQGENWPLPNVWLGTSVENQKAADNRVYHLLRAVAAVRFLSCEPLLGAVDLRHVQYDRLIEFDSLTGDHGVARPLAGRSDARLHWIIAGGESGPGARPMHPDWARGLRDQCAAAGVAFHFKQWGEYGPTQALDHYAEKHPQLYHRWPDNLVSPRVGKRSAGRLLDDRTHDEFPASQPREAALTV